MEFLLFSYECICTVIFGIRRSPISSYSLSPSSGGLTRGLTLDFWSCDGSFLYATFFLTKYFWKYEMPYWELKTPLTIFDKCRSSFCQQILRLELGTNNPFCIWQGTYLWRNNHLAKILYSDRRTSTTRSFCWGILLVEGKQKFTEWSPFSDKTSAIWNKLI